MVRCILYIIGISIGCHKLTLLVLLSFYSLPEKRKRAESSDQILDQMDYFHPVIVPPSMYDHGEL